jgi:hypothetical protein
MFLKLTGLYSDKKIRINSTAINAYGPELDRSQDKYGLTVVGSYVETKLQSYIVKETPEEIDGLLSSSYVMIKEAYENRTSEVPQHTTNSAVNDSEQPESGSC